MNVAFVVVSESTSVDRFTNRMSLFHVMDDMTVSSIPSMIPQLAVSTIVEREPKDALRVAATLRITLNSEVAAQFPLDLDFSAGNKIRVVQNIGGIILSSPGVLKFQIEHGNTVLKCWDTQVQLVGKPTIQDEIPEKPVATQPPIAKEVSEKRAGKRKISDATS